jgi:hypothetical protein
MALRHLLHPPVIVEQSTGGGEGAPRLPVGSTPNLAYLVPNSILTLPTRSRRQGDSDLLTYAAENGPRVAGDDGVARLMSVNSEGALRWSFSSRNDFGSGGSDRWSSFE